MNIYIRALLGALCAAPILWLYAYVISACILAARADKHSENFKVQELDKLDDL